VTACDDGDGVLVLSQFTGAARELRDALIVNPYDTEQLADAFRHALEMGVVERHGRMERMRRIVGEHNVYRWAATLIGDLAEIRVDAPRLSPRFAARRPDVADKRADNTGKIDTVDAEEAAPLAEPHVIS
jgi:trehalose-6-phosphate synthase